MEKASLKEQISARIKKLTTRMEELRTEISKLKLVRDELKKSFETLNNVEKQIRKQLSKKGQTDQELPANLAETSSNLPQDQVENRPNFTFGLGLVQATEATHREAIKAILRANGGPLRTAEIAKRAFEGGFIKSDGGLRGVSNIVNTVLYRNKKHTFHKESYGVWSLREDREAGDQIARTPKVAMDG